MMIVCLPSGIVKKPLNLLASFFYQLCFTDTLTRDNECHEEK